VSSEVLQEGHEQGNIHWSVRLRRDNQPAVQYSLLYTLASKGLRWAGGSQLSLAPFFMSSRFAVGA
jgi:hypothetical protein